MCYLRVYLQAKAFVLVYDAQNGYDLNTKSGASKMIPNTQIAVGDVVLVEALLAPEKHAPSSNRKEGEDVKHPPTPNDKNGSLSTDKKATGKNPALPSTTNPTPAKNSDCEPQRQSPQSSQDDERTKGKQANKSSSSSADDTGDSSKETLMFKLVDIILLAKGNKPEGVYGSPKNDT